jgi:hypothetical protein
MVALAFAEPPAPVQVSVYVSVVVRLFSDCEPLVVFVPVQPPKAVQEVAFVEDQVSVELPPEVTDVGLAERVTVGAALAVLSVA